MDLRDKSKEELIKFSEKQGKIIQGFLGISWFYSVIKGAPFIGRFFVYLAGILKSGTVSSLKIVNHVSSKNPEIIGVCSPHPLNRGVQSATYALTKDVIEVSEIFSQKIARKVAQEIISYNPSKVIISGYVLGYDLLAKEVKRLAPKTRIFTFIHSSFTWFGIDMYKAENPVFDEMIKLARTGIIEKIGFCKRDLAEYFKSQGVNAFFVMNRFDIPVKEFKKHTGDAIKVGIFGNNWWHRNILNQVVAALMIPGTEIHVNEIGDHDFLDNERIVVHGLLPKADFDKLFEQMDINLYVSFTDCFPMTLVESMEKGIPALASDTSDVYSFDEKLKQSLVVSTIDGPLGIAKKIEEVIADYDAIQGEIKKYLPELKKRVELSIEDFLS